MASNLTSLSSVSQIISVGSVDGICTSAALLRWLGKENKEVGLAFCQAFTVDKVDVSTWQPQRHVALVDLAVNNRAPEMTRVFVEQLRSAGHQLVAVIDEHSREDWLECLGNFDGLAVEPKSQSEGKFLSAGSVLAAAIGDEADAHTLELLEAADAGDRMNFDTRFGAIVNQAVKSRIRDDSRRVKLARYLAFNREADEQIAGWMAEYQQILANHDQIVDGKVDLADGIHRVVATGLQVDMTTLMRRMYDGGAKVVALQGEGFVPAEKRKRELLALGTNDKGLDLMSLVREAGIPPLGGFAQKVNVDLQDEQAALAAIREKLSS